MKKLYVIFFGILAFVLSGCFTSTKMSDETYAQTRVEIYLDYHDFSCVQCYYEMYWCFHCQTYHVRMTHMCHNHYYWYHGWYKRHYYKPHAYYYWHYRDHSNYRDVTRHYIRDNSGLRNHRGGKSVITDKGKSRRTDVIKQQPPVRRNDNVIKQREPIKRNNDVIKQREQTKRNDNIKQSPPVKRNENIRKQNETKRNTQTYERRDTQKQQNSGSKQNRKR